MRFRYVFLSAAFLTTLVATTAGAAEDLSRQVLAEINLARTQPRQYAEQLKKLRGMFDGKAYREPGSGAIVITNEGVAAVDEAIDFLSQQSPVGPLTWSEGLSLAAEDLAREEGKSGEIGHDGRSSGTMRQRIERHGTWRKTIGENIGYGPSTARMMVQELVIDDGVSGRGHRKNIFSSAFKVAGIACGSHPTYRKMCVTDFAGGFEDKRQAKHGKKKK